MQSVDGVVWFLANRQALIDEHGADFAAAINGAGDCIVRRSAKEAQTAYDRTHPKVPSALIIVGAAS